MVLKDVLPHVRFPSMTMAEIATNVGPSEVLEPPQLLEIYTYLGLKDKTDVKANCSFNTVERAGPAIKWLLDDRNKSNMIVVSNKNHTARNGPGQGHGYIHSDKPLPKKGQHAWRVHIDAIQATTWVFVGVGKMKQYPNANTYNDPGTWGWSSASQTYKAGANAANDATNWVVNSTLDVLFDVDEGKLTVLNVNTNAKVEMSGIPKNEEYGPHFNIYGDNQITTYPIPVKSHGKKEPTKKFE